MRHMIDDVGPIDGTWLTACGITAREMMAAWALDAVSCRRCRRTWVFKDAMQVAEARGRKSNTKIPMEVGGTIESGPFKGSVSVTGELEASP